MPQNHASQNTALKTITGTFYMLNGKVLELLMPYTLSNASLSMAREGNGETLNIVLDSHLS